MCQKVATTIDNRGQIRLVIHGCVLLCRVLIAAVNRETTKLKLKFFSNFSKEKDSSRKEITIPL